MNEITVMLDGEAKSALNEARYQLDNCTAGSTFDETLNTIMDSH